MAMVPLVDNWVLVRMHNVALMEPTQSEVGGFERHGVAQCTLRGLISERAGGQTGLWRLPAERQRNNRPLARLELCLMPSLAPLIPRLGAGGLGSTNLRPGSFLVCRSQQSERYLVRKDP